MASSSSKFWMILLLSCSIFLQGIMGELICEKLLVDVCAFSIDSSGKRCVLENFKNGVDGQMEFQCVTSKVVVPMMAEHIESQFCIDICELDRKTVRISSDAFLDKDFMSRLCSDDCTQNCPNIVDLYSKLATAEGKINLRVLCDGHNFPVAQGSEAYRILIRDELLHQLLNTAKLQALDLDVASVPAFAPVTL